MKRFFLFFSLALLVMLSQPGAHGADKEAKGPVRPARCIAGVIACIDWKSANQIVIGDTAYHTSSDTLYFDKNGQRTGPANRFRLGDCVRVVADAEYRVIAMYEAVEDKMESKPGLATSSATGRSSGRAGDGIRFVNGAWRN